MNEALVLVPYRPDFDHRDRIFTHLKDNYWKHTGLDVVVGETRDNPFNRSRAINLAARLRDWEFAVIADADTWVPAKQLYEALVKAKATGKLVAAFDAVVEINRQCTLEILDGKRTIAGSFDTDRVRTRELETQSSMLVIPRAVWDATGGFDERFQGFGCEDNAFYRAATLHAGQPERVSGNAYHLWHSFQPGRFHGIQYKRNLNLWHKYQRATTVDELP